MHRTQVLSDLDAQYFREKPASSLDYKFAPTFPYGLYNQFMKLILHVKCERGVGNPTHRPSKAVKESKTPSGTVVRALVSRSLCLFVRDGGGLEGIENKCGNGDCGENLADFRIIVCTLMMWQVQT